MQRIYVSILELINKINSRIIESKKMVRCVPYIQNNYNTHIECPIKVEPVEADETDQPMGQSIYFNRLMLSYTNGSSPYDSFSYTKEIEIPYILEWELIKNSGYFKLNEAEWEDIQVAMITVLIGYFVIQQAEDIHYEELEDLEIENILINTENWPLHYLDSEDRDGIETIMQEIYKTFEPEKVALDKEHKKQWDTMLKTPLSSKDALTLISTHEQKFGEIEMMHMSQLILPTLMSFYVLERKAGVFKTYNYQTYKDYRRLCKLSHQNSDELLKWDSNKECSEFSYGWFHPYAYRYNLINAPDDAYLLRKVLAQIYLQIKEDMKVNSSVLTIDQVYHTMENLENVVVLLNDGDLSWEG